MGERRVGLSAQSPPQLGRRQALRAAQACFAFVHGSRATPGGARPDSDLDVAARWGVAPPDAWDVDVPGGVDLLVPDTGPLWMVGRVAQYGRLLFDDPRPRVAWQADTRLRDLDERPAIEQCYRERTRQIARGAVHGRPGARRPAARSGGRRRTRAGR